MPQNLTFSFIFYRWVHLLSLDSPGERTGGCQLSYRIWLPSPHHQPHHNWSSMQFQTADYYVLVTLSQYFFSSCIHTTTGLWSCVYTTTGLTTTGLWSCVYTTTGLTTTDLWSWHNFTFLSSSAITVFGCCTVRVLFLYPIHSLLIRCAGYYYQTIMYSAPTTLWFIKFANQINDTYNYNYMHAKGSRVIELLNKQLFSFPWPVLSWHPVSV